MRTNYDKSVIELEYLAIHHGSENRSENLVIFNIVLVVVEKLCPEP